MGGKSFATLQTRFSIDNYLLEQGFGSMLTRFSTFLGGSLQIIGKSSTIAAVRAPKTGLDTGHDLMEFILEASLLTGRANRKLRFKRC